MPYVDWSPDLELGIDIVDHDHRVLVSLLNQAHDCMGGPEESATLGSVLNALVDYSELHFAREERIMDAAGFLETDDHRELHRRLTRQAQEVRDRYIADPGAVRLPDAITFLRTWLIDHIVKQDFRFQSVVLACPDAIEKGRVVDFESHGEVAPDFGNGSGRDGFDHQARGDSAADAATEGAAPDFSGLSALVVDDNKNFQIILRTILKGLGCPDVQVVDGGQPGLEAITATAPSLILVDWRMDSMDGLTFVRSVRDQGVLAPIVMVTGYNKPGFSDQARDAGVNGLLEKPITARALVETVSRAMLDAETAKQS